MNIKLTTPFMTGSAVVRIQEMLDLLDLDSGPNDGIYGPRTEAKVKEFQGRHPSMIDDGIVGPITTDMLVNFCADLHTGTIHELITDRRNLHKKPKLFGRRRESTDISGVCLHQTGCNMPNRSTGWDRLNAHIGITQEGKVIIVNDFEDMIWHAQGLSPTTIGIEVEGNFFGQEYKPYTFWKPGGEVAHLNPEMIDAIDACYEYLCNWMNKHTNGWKYVFAHRQSSKNRASCPGQEIWRHVGLPWIEKLGASDGGAGYCKGTGRTIPNCWDRDRNGAF